MLDEGAYRPPPPTPDDPPGVVHLYLQEILMAVAKSRSGRLVLALLMLAAVLAIPAPAVAHPEVCGEKTGETSGGVVASMLAVLNIFSDFLPAEAEEQIDEKGAEICFSEGEIAMMDDSGADLQPGETASSDNVSLLANLPKTGPFDGDLAYNSDLAFWGDYAFQGNYEGFQITDVSDPANPGVVSQVDCPGSQNDISVWGDLVITSTDSRRTNDGCDNEATSDPVNYWEGIKVFDWSDPANPELVSSVATDCGSHTHTILPEDDRILVYVSSYSPNAALVNCQPPHDKISIVEIPIEDPGASAVIAEPVLFPDGGHPGGPIGDSQFPTSATSGCHDITVYQAIGLAAGACMGEGVMMDISDPEAPEVISTMLDGNFAFWHSATISNDGDTVVFTDELGGGGGPTCNPTVGPNRGANAYYDISDPTDPQFRSYFKIPRTQANSENCVAHNGNLIPVPGRDIMVQAWYQGGLSIVDFTNPRRPRELGWFERGPFRDVPITGSSLSGGWSTYFYNGMVFTNEIQEGLDVHEFRDPISRRAAELPHMNAQSQEPFPRPGRGRGRG